MEQEEFYAMLDQAFAGKTLEEIEEIIRVVKDAQMALYLEDRLKGYFKCSECGKFSPFAEYTIEEKKEEIPAEACEDHVTIHGKRRYYLCPKCGKVGFEAFIRNHDDDSTKP